MMLEYSKDTFHANRYDRSISEWFQWIQKAELDAKPKRLCKQDLEDLSKLQNCFSPSQSPYLTPGLTSMQPPPTSRG